LRREGQWIGDRRSVEEQRRKEAHVKTHKDLNVWDKAVDLAQETYRVTSGFPRSEMLGLVSQMRRAAVSIASNIAEGAARQSKKEFIHFLYIALGSVAELDTQHILATRLGFTKQDAMTKSTEDVRMLLCGLIRYLKNRP
jgi:four helix bundle protein